MHLCKGKGPVHHWQRAAPLALPACATWRPRKSPHIPIQAISADTVSAAPRMAHQWLSLATWRLDWPSLVGPYTGDHRGTHSIFHLRKTSLNKNTLWHKDEIMWCNCWTEHLWAWVWDLYPYPPHFRTVKSWGRGQEGRRGEVEKDGRSPSGKT